MSDSAHFSALTKTIQTLDFITEKIGTIISWLTLFTVCLMAIIVVLRYGFDIGWIAMQEATIYMHATVFMLGAAYTLKHDEHVRVDIFYRPMNKVKKAWINIIGTVFLLVPVCIFIGISSWDYVMSSWQLLEGSAEAGGIKGVFYLKTLILALVATLFLQGLAEFLRNIQIVKASARGQS